MDRQTQNIEKDLLKRAKDGDSSAFAEIVELYDGKVYNLGLKFLHTKEDAEDILQETFLSVFKSIKYFKEKSSLSTWIYKIAMNTILMKIRKRGSKEFFNLDEYPIDMTRDFRIASQNIPEEPLDGLLNQEFKEKIETYLDIMPENYKSVFILRDIENLSTKEVSSILGLSVPAVKSNLHRARIFLRDKLSDYIEEKK